MEKQETSRQDQVVVNGLSEQVISELDLMLTLNISRLTLDRLRLEKGFPVVRLSSTARVYITDDVLDWLKK